MQQSSDTTSQQPRSFYMVSLIMLVTALILGAVFIFAHIDAANSNVSQFSPGGPLKTVVDTDQAYQSGQSMPQQHQNIYHPGQTMYVIVATTSSVKPGDRFTINWTLGQVTSSQIQSTSPTCCEATITQSGEQVLVFELMLTDAYNNQDGSYQVMYNDQSVYTHQFEVNSNASVNNPVKSIKLYFHDQLTTGIPTLQPGDTITVRVTVDDSIHVGDNLRLTIVVYTNDGGPITQSTPIPGPHCCSVSITSSGAQTIDFQLIIPSIGRFIKGFILYNGLIVDNVEPINIAINNTSGNAQAEQGMANRFITHQLLG
jgi:hypothetical protein